MKGILLYRVYDETPKPKSRTPEPQPYILTPKLKAGTLAPALNSIPQTLQSLYGLSTARG